MRSFCASVLSFVYLNKILSVTSTGTVTADEAFEITTHLNHSSLVRKNGKIFFANISLFFFSIQKSNRYSGKLPVLKNTDFI